MLNLTFKITAKQKGATGKLQNFTEKFQCENLGIAKGLLYEKYDHITVNKLTGAKLEDYNNSNYIKP